MGAKPKTPRGRSALVEAARAQRQAIIDSGLPLAEATEPEGRNATKGRILDTAIALFAERGFAACTMRDLASEVGIKAPAIYNHYSSKDAVLAAAMEHILGRFFASLLPPLEEKPVEDWLESLVRGHVVFQLDHPRLSRANDALLNAPGTEQILPPDVYRRIVGVERGYVELISILTRLIEPGNGKWDAMMAGFAVTAMCDRVVAWYDPSGTLKPQQVADHSWKLARQMIGSG